MSKRRAKRGAARRGQRYTLYCNWILSKTSPRGRRSPSGARLGEPPGAREACFGAAIGTVPGARSAAEQGGSFMEAGTPGSTHLNRVPAPLLVSARARSVTIGPCVELRAGVDRGGARAAKRREDRGPNGDGGGVREEEGRRVLHVRVRRPSRWAARRVPPCPRRAAAGPTEDTRPPARARRAGASTEADRTAPCPRRP